MDGKHIVMQAPARSGSYFFNYKKSHSIVLMAVCNANYQFTLIDIGDTGRNSDGGVFGNSDMGIAFESNKIPVSTRCHHDVGFRLRFNRDLKLTKNDVELTSG